MTKPTRAPKLAHRLGWWLYDVGYLLGFCVYLPRALWRRRVPHPGWAMRLGRYPEAVRHALAGRETIWVHAVSVGEVLAAQPLLMALLAAYPDNQFVISTVTPGGYQTAKAKLGERVTLIYFPLDLSGCVRRAFDAIRPRAMLLVESELWPHVLAEAAARDVPVILVNGRVSPRSVRRAHWIAPAAACLTRRITRFLMQSQEDADRAIMLGAPADRVQVTGNLKWDASIQARPVPAEIEATRRALGLAPGAQLIVAGSTHRGEEDAMLRAFARAAASRPDLRLVIAPRHLERLSEVEALASRSGGPVARLSQSPLPAGWRIGLIDQFGVLTKYYGLATVVFIGGSLIPHGGQNPLEPASLGKPVIFGPSMHNFAVITHQLLAHRAARQIASAEELPGLLEELLGDPQAAGDLGARAQELTERFQGVVQRTCQALAPFLTPRR